MLPCCCHGVAAARRVLPSEPSAGVSLLDLPEACLVVVLQGCAADGASSLFSAARAHSRLHQAALLALHSLAVTVARQQQVDSVLMFLGKHGGGLVRSLAVRATVRGAARLRQLPPNLQLTSLQLERVRLQAQARRGWQGMLAASVTSTLKQLRLSHIEAVGNTDDALEVTLRQLPAGLEHLSIRNVNVNGARLVFDFSVLQQLQQLTHLELASTFSTDPWQQQPAVQALPKLADLRVCDTAYLVDRIIAGLLSGTQHLTRLELTHCTFQPEALNGKTLLQHLRLEGCYWRYSDAELLSQLQHLQQLTHLSLGHTLMNVSVRPPSPPAAAFAAVTASSKLQHLDISRCTVPAGVWQYLLRLASSCRT